MKDLFGTPKWDSDSDGDDSKGPNHLFLIQKKKPSKTSVPKVPKMDNAKPSLKKLKTVEEEQVPLLNESNVSNASKKKKKKKKKKNSNNDSKVSNNSNNSSSGGVGSLLRKGIKFSNSEEFSQFLNHNDDEKEKTKKKLKKKSQQEGGKKRKLSETSLDDEEGVQKNVEKIKKKSRKDDNIHCKFDVGKIRQLLKSSSKDASNQNDNKTTTLSKAQKTLKSSRFRFINEKLYTQSGSASLKMFKKDPEAFKVYHEGFMDQAKKWPVDPLNLIISALLKRSDEPIIADFGCGEARLARALTSNKVYSFDLVKLNDYVTVCDMSKVPLEDNSVDVVVFCLSLMGTNLKDYLKEANRILKLNGTIKIAEVESRFLEIDVPQFIGIVEKLGFKIKWKDLSHQFFYLMDFKKISGTKKKIPDFSLKPCVYKKR